MTPHVSTATAVESQHPMLEVSDATLRFGGITALNDVSLAVSKGDICGLIGPNGAGKTTLFNSVTRLYSLTSGSLRFDGNALDQVHPRSIIGMGIARTFQNLGIYQDMTVLENVMMGAHHRMRHRIFGCLLWPFAADHEERDLGVEALGLLEVFGMESQAHAMASSLPYGTLKRVEIARALMAKPKLLLLDEPAAGLTHAEVDAFGELLQSLRARFDLTIMLVEHHMGLVCAVCTRVVALHLGRKLAEGTAAQVQRDPRVVEAYLGAAT